LQHAHENGGFENGEIGRDVVIEFDMVSARLTLGQANRSLVELTETVNRVAPSRTWG
jgi:hypothetical protein